MAMGRNLAFSHVGPANLPSLPTPRGPVVAHCNTLKFGVSKICQDNAYK
jgi:hypothetical protein